MEATFVADKVKVHGPKIDGTFTVTFETGEYAWEQIKELPSLNGTSLQVKVTQYEQVQSS